MTSKLPEGTPWEAHGIERSATVWTAGRRNRICCIDDVAEPLVLARAIAALPEIVAFIEDLAEERGRAYFSDRASLRDDARARLEKAGLR